MASPPPFLAGLRLEGRRACVVGGGPDVARRTRDLERAGARVLQLGVDWFPEDFLRCRVVVICLDDWAAAAEAAREAGALVYVPDVPEASDLVLPAIVRRRDLQIAVSTGGRSPATARRLMELVDAWLPESTEAALEAMAEARADMPAAGEDLPPYELWAEALDAGLAADADSAWDAVWRVLGRLE